MPSDTLAMTPAPAADVLQADMPCMTCGYNLRTQSANGVCPECGTTIRDTLNFPHLKRSPPRWLTSLVDSTTVLLLTLPLLTAACFVSRSRDDVIGAVPVAAAWGLCWFAFWLLTRPEPGATVSRRERARAWALRAFVTGPCLAFAVPRFGDMYNWRYAYPRLFAVGDLGLLVAPALLACALPATFLYYDHLRRAARRLPSRALAWQAAILRWALPLTMLLSFAGMALLGRPPERLTELLRRVPMPAVGSVGDAAAYVQALRAGIPWNAELPLTLTPGIVCMAWAVATLVQFRLAFAAARRARQRPDRG